MRYEYEPRANKQQLKYLTKLMNRDDEAISPDFNDIWEQFGHLALLFLKQDDFVFVSLPLFCVLIAIAVSKKSKAGMFSGLIGLLTIGVSFLTGERTNFLIRAFGGVLSSVVWKFRQPTSPRGTVSEEASRSRGEG